MNESQDGEVGGGSRARVGALAPRAVRPRSVRLAATILLPAFNEEEAIVPVIRETQAVMDAQSLAYEIVVVDDASTDHTAEMAEACGVRVIRRPERGGAGAARKTGLRASRGDVVVMMDADGSYDPADIPRLLAYFPQYDQVNGARRSECGSWPWLRRPAKWAIRMFASYLAGRRIPDLNTGLKAVRRDLMLRYLWVVPDGFSCVTTMSLAFLTSGHAVRYVPVNYRPRIGRSKFHPLRDTWHYIATVVRMITYFRPLRVFGPLALLLGVGGVAKSIHSFSTTGTLQESDVILIVSAVMTCICGLLADMIAAYGRR